MIFFLKNMIFLQCPNSEFYELKKSVNRSLGFRSLSAETEQYVRLLAQLAEKGIYRPKQGRGAGRFIDEALRRFAETPQLKLGLSQTRKTDEIPKMSTQISQGAALAHIVSENGASSYEPLISVWQGSNGICSK